MKYYALSALQSEVEPISLVEVGTLYENIKQAGDKLEVGYLPWYNFETTSICELPENPIFVLKDKKISVSLRNINGNIYIINDVLKSVFEKYLKVNFISVKIMDETLNEILESKYYIFRLNCALDYKEVLDIDKSRYKLYEDYLVFENINFLSKIESNIFRIIDITSIQDTIFISETVKIEILDKKFDGITAFDVSLAKWQDPEDFLNFLFEGEEAIPLTVWPI